MSLIYDLETDIRYQQAYKKAKEEYEKKAKEEAAKKAKEKEEQQEHFIINLLKLKVLAKKAIADAANTTVDFVKKVEEKLIAEQKEEAERKNKQANKSLKEEK